MDNLHWLGHDGFRIDGPCTVYIDPWNIPGGQPVADLILITHDHFDHCSPDDVALISDENTLILTCEQSADILADTTSAQIQIMLPGENLEHKGAKITAIRAYNTNKFRSPDTPFHPREADYLGFIVSMDGKSVYHAGDTDHIPEMNDLEVDVALLPVSGTYVMSWVEAVSAAGNMNADLVIPMHYGAIVGDADDARNFARGYSGRTLIL